MKPKIESIALRSRSSLPFQEFVATLAALKPGESFLAPSLRSHYRVAISVLQYALHRTYTTRRAGERLRIGRIT